MFKCLTHIFFLFTDQCTMCTSLWYFNTGMQHASIKTGLPSHLLTFQTLVNTIPHSVWLFKTSTLRKNRYNLSVCVTVLLLILSSNSINFIANEISVIVWLKYIALWIYTIFCLSMHILKVAKVLIFCTFYQWDCVLDIFDSVVICLKK